MEMTDEQARALLALSGNDLGACLEFIAAQENGQNVPPNEQPRTTNCKALLTVVLNKF